MTNWRFVNCIDISLIFRCILLPLLLTHYILDCLLLQSREKAHFTLIAANIICFFFSFFLCLFLCFFPFFFFCIIYSSEYAEKTQEWNKQMFCFVALCILYVLNLLLNGSDIIKPFSLLSYVYIYLFMLWFPVIFFMKVPFNVSCSVLRKYSIPHSLLLYSVHVKWILICVQNVDKDENTLDYILCTHLCCVLLFVDS